MTIKVKYLSKQQIERDALNLLEAYFHELGQPVQVPVPTDEILETYLGFSLGFADLSSRLGMPDTDILGAMWVDRREVLIDQSLDPHVHPEMEGRFYFTCGHEAGHWWEHRSYITGTDSQASTFGQNQPRPGVICRSRQAKEPIEWQADYFSSCLLMPRQHVLDAWSARFGALRPFVYTDDADQACPRRNKYRGLRPIQEILLRAIEETFEPHTCTFETIAKEFKPMFSVSTQAMRIRLESLGLLQIGYPVEQGLAGGY